jgi:uncharacterized membrane protein YgdD (TMEM256/DUF423 family)
MNWSAVGAAALGLAVMIGAFGAHALRARLDAYSTSIYERAVFYHFVHALGILIVSTFAKSTLLSPSSVTWVCALLLTGIMLFCGSLYTLAITGVRTWGAVTPFGGISFIAAWLLLAYLLVRGPR